MTICVAALTNTGAVVLAADRMVTTHAAGYEPKHQKMISLTSSIVLLWAGQLAAQSDIIAMLRREIAKSGRLTTKDEWGVWEIADLYSRCRDTLHARTAEQLVLTPLDLTWADWTATQATLAIPLVNFVLAQLPQVIRPDVEAIIAGTDETGAHLYVANAYTTSCYDLQGWAAIGTGATLAQSEMFEARQSAGLHVLETIWNVFCAKKRAEAAPGIGVETDMWALSEAAEPFPDTLMAKFRDRYEGRIEAIAGARQQTLNSVAADVDALFPPESQDPAGDLPG